ncbi:MAG: isoaspartyl peptidase/L-asparaginase [Caulobacter sp.]|nr:isoaspartyl peptidase/L-asparaginase [Caulobacter sp.]
MPERPDWAVIVHGGARTIPEPLRERHRQGCLEAVAAAATLLAAGRSAVAAVESAVRVLEADPTFNAGRGSVPNAAGEVECDAAIMDGRDLAVGAVAAVRTLRHPISVARLLLYERPVLLVAEGAEAFARAHGAEICDPDHLRNTETQHAGCDTVGCVAIDARGNIAAGTSTGGLSGCAVGRVGDSPLPGCGLYADDAVGGVSLSGEGESLIRTTLAARLIQALEHDAPQAAIAGALGRLERVGGEAGLIVIDRHGRIGWDHTSDHFAVARASAAEPARAFIHRDEDKGSDA